MNRLCRYTQAAVEYLRSAVEENLDWYYDPTERPPHTPLGEFRETTIDAPELSERLKMEGNQPQLTDVGNALIVFSALSSLTPHQATFEGIWVYICHCDCPQYVSWRWPGKRPPDAEADAKNIRNHFFAKGNRALIRDNGISRLWWLGKIANDAAPDEPRKFLEILLHLQDVRSALIERPSISMNRDVLRGIYEVMREHWDNGGELFKRGVFRAWMKELNLQGGVILLDALPKEALMSLLRKEAEKALKEGSKPDGG